MNPKDLERSMREFESATKMRTIPDMEIVARLDGRGFSSLTQSHFEKPFDPHFRDHMIATLRRLVECGPKIRLAYSQSDEISLWFDTADRPFDGRLEKLATVLAGEASAAFSLSAQIHAAFDARIIQFPNRDWVARYFNWRQSDGTRNALNGYCYWTLCNSGMSAKQATRKLEGISVAEKNELLFAHGINFNDIPAWQKRGMALIRETYEKKGFDPVKKTEVTVSRNRFALIDDLPFSAEFESWVGQL